MKILVHICCAPCSIYPFKELLKGGSNQIKGFYFNPNIHPYQEYLNRRLATEQYSKRVDMEIIYPDYEPNQFFRKIVYAENKPMRCRICWELRLKETASYAVENGFNSFSTTLLISPYQDHVIIKNIGEELALRFDLNFYYKDFRVGFRESQDEAAGQSLYRQKYCGCIYSEMERFEKKDYRDLKKITAIS